MSLEFCFPPNPIPSPTGPYRLHEVKYDGYRLRLERDGDRVRLITRGGYNWADRNPWIVVAASAALATNRPSAAFEAITFIVGPP
jgi:bifunctional non-homologous end joining protein LigD